MVKQAYSGYTYAGTHKYFGIVILVKTSYYADSFRWMAFNNIGIGIGMYGKEYPNHRNETYTFREALELAANDDKMEVFEFEREEFSEWLTEIISKPRHWTQYF